MLVTIEFISEEVNIRYCQSKKPEVRKKTHKKITKKPEELGRGPMGLLKSNGV